MRLSQVLVLIPTLMAAVGAVQAAKPSPSIYKVKKGDTAGKIALQHKMKLAQLAKLNPKINLSKLSLGTTLRVSGTPPRPSVKPVQAEPEVEETAQTDLLEARKEPLAPVEALPSIPSTAPSTLIHLERVLPDSLRFTAPVLPGIGPAPSPATAPTVSQFSPILPSSGLEYESQVAASLGFEPADPAHLDLLWPVQTRTVSSAWGPRIRTRTVRIVKANMKRRIRVRYRSSHKGLDLTGPVGSDVYAAMDGRVVLAGKHRQYGNFLIVEHGNGIQTLYAHHRINFARQGDIVQRGQKIAEVGRTGNATGPHLHFELRMQGQPQNPLPFLNDVEEIPAELMAYNNAATPPSQRH